MIEKNILRKQILAARDELDQNKRKFLSEKIFQQFSIFLEDKKIDTVYVYLHFGSEVETTAIINHLFDCSKTVAVPRTDRLKKSMNAVIVGKNFKTVSGAYGISEPDHSFTELLEPSDIDCVILPGAVFDRHGGRIGYGGGYYDIFLNKCRENIVTVGMAFSFQVKEHIVQEEHDVRLKYVITENEILSCVKG